MNQNIIDQIDGELQELNLAESRLKKDLHSIQSNIKNLVKARALLANEPATGRKKPSTTSLERPRPKRTDEILEYMKEWSSQEWCSKDLAISLNMSQPSVNEAINHLRAEGKIDLVRTGGKTNTTRFFKAAMNHAEVT